MDAAARQEDTGAVKTLGEMNLCVSSGGMLFWLSAEGLFHIMSGRALLGSVTEDGTAELDGRTVSVVSLRALLGLPAGEERHALLLDRGGGLVGLLVDEVLDALGAPPEAVIPLPEAVLWAENRFLMGLVLLPGREQPAYAVDLERLLNGSGGEG